MIGIFLVKQRTNLTHPETFDLDRVHNFYLNVEPKISLGIWFVQNQCEIFDKLLFSRHFRSPLIEDQSYTDDEDYAQKYFTSESKTIPIIIYLHGNALDR